MAGRDAPRLTAQGAAGRFSRGHSARSPLRAARRRCARLIFEQTPHPLLSISPPSASALSPSSPAAAHRNHLGGGLTPFGEAFAAAKHAWSLELCCTDDDADGFTAGEELGDPCCAWRPGATPAWTGDIGSPGDAASVPGAGAPRLQACAANPCTVLADARSASKQRDNHSVRGAAASA
jgi:hypothetical protein